MRIEAESRASGTGGDMNIVDSPAFWTHSFTLTAYLMAIGCIYCGVREGSRPGHFPLAWLREPMVFGLFVVSMWLLESYALYRTPYYAYSSTFSDKLPRLLSDWLPKHVEPGLTNACTMRAQSHADHIPLSVLLFEASLAYAAMWLTRRLTIHAVAQPVLAGLLMLGVDLILDPVVARSHGCNAITLPESANGIGLWHWFVPVTAADLAGHSALAHWFNVPVFNFGLWFAGPVLSISLTNLIGAGFRQLVFRDSAIPDHLRVRRSGALLLVIPAAVLFAILIAPNFELPVVAQHLLLIGGVAAAVAYVARTLSQCTACDDSDKTPALIITLAFAYALVAFVVTASFVSLPELQWLALGAGAFGLWISWLPYRRALERFLDGAQSVSRFVRVEYFSFTSMLVLLGAGMSTPAADAYLLIALLVFAVGFHVFAYVLNDIIDLPLDQHVASRKQDLLVRGAISTKAAGGLVAAGFAISCLTLLHVASFSLASNLILSCVLVSAFALMTLYNLYGKRIRLTPLTDLSQGISWGLLAFIGLGLGTAHASRACEPQLPAASASLLTGGPLVLFIYAAGFLFLINGIHGGLRDFVTDHAHGKQTTAILLGARKTSRDVVLSSVPIAVFAYAVQTAMFVGLGWLVAHNAERFPDLRLVSFSLLVLFVMNTCWLWMVVKRESPARLKWLNEHLFVLLLPPLVVLLSVDGLSQAVRCTVVTMFIASLALRPALFRKLSRRVYLGRPWRLWPNS